MIYLLMQITSSLIFNYDHLYNKIILKHLIAIVIYYLPTLQDDYIISKSGCHVSLGHISLSIILIIFWRLLLSIIFYPSSIIWILYLFCLSSWFSLINSTLLKALSFCFGFLVCASSSSWAFSPIGAI